jgi:hypothetical protein
MKKDKIVRNILDKAAAEYIEIKTKQEQEEKLIAINHREAHFEKNYKKK